MPNFWMVRAGSGSSAFEEFVRQSCVAIGFGCTAEVMQADTRERVAAVVERMMPDAKQGTRVGVTGMVHKFVNAMREGDRVLTYDSQSRVYRVGTIAGPAAYRPEAVNGYPLVRPVEWEGEIARDGLSTAARNTLGSVMTLFEPGDEVASEIDGLLSRPANAERTSVDAAVPDSGDESADGGSDYESVRIDAAEKSREFIKDRISALDWEQMQELVAALLRAMGYKTRVSPRGSDRGKDITASPDGLGLSPPRIKVEVKHRSRTQMGSQDVRSFLGGLRADDRGLYVSTGGFSTEARYEAERATVPVTLVTLDDLVQLLVQHYDRIDAEGRALVPLTPVYFLSS